MDKKVCDCATRDDVFNAVDSVLAFRAKQFWKSIKIGLCIIFAIATPLFNVFVLAKAIPEPNVCQIIMLVFAILCPVIMFVLILHSVMED